MKRVVLLVFISFVSKMAIAQIPQGFNYQAIARDVSGNPIANSTIKIKLSILTDTLGFYLNGSGNYLWEEEQTNIKTNAFGLFTAVLGSPLATKIQGSAANFSAIGWAKTPLYIGTKIANPTNYKNLGSAQLWAVPYSMVAGNLNDTLQKLIVKGETTNMEEALFEVKNKNGQTVFAVYNEGVRVYVYDGVAKGATKGGFAIGGFGTVKAPGKEYFRVTPDSTRIYIDNTTKGATKGGFAIGGFDQVKHTQQNYLVVNSDSIRAYIDTNPVKGATKGGFAIGGFDQVKGEQEEYFRVTRDSTRIYINEGIAKGATKGGFAIGGFGTGKGLPNDYMLVRPDSTNFYVRTFSTQISSTFNILGFDQNESHKSLFTANTDTITVSDVMNIQNNLNVSGNIDVGGSLNLISDIDGNSYQIVTIGTQTWMKENLKTTKYNDGTTIPNVTDNATWAALTTGAYSDYSNTPAISNTYGRLYNWYAVDNNAATKVASNGGKNVCPTNWHVPSDAEWTTLKTFLGGEAVAGGKLKETGISHWVTPNEGATNSSGFTALPGGYRSSNGIYDHIGNFGYWWSSTDYFNIYPYFTHMGYFYANAYTSNSSLKPTGLSVRCVRD